MKADKPIIKEPKDVIYLLNKYRYKRQEHFIVVTLNSVHQVIKHHVVSIGLVNKTIVHPREVYYWAIKDNAASVMFVHNHPSGSAEPSMEDHEITERLSGAGRILGFNVLDHIILSRGSWFSFAAMGLIDINKKDVTNIIEDRYEG